MKIRAKKTVFYLILIIFFVIIVTEWWYGTYSYFSTGETTSKIIGTSRLIGLLTAFLLPMQLILIGRVKWVETVFGLDKLSRLHRINGLIILGLILTHPFLMILSYSLLNGSSFVSQWWAFLHDWDNILLAFMGIMTLVCTIVLSITIVRKRLKYEWWYYVHVFNYVAITLIFLHVKEMTRVSDNLLWSLFWIGIYIFTALNVLWFRFARPSLRFYQHKFSVSKVDDLGFATSIHISGRNMEKFKIKPGQFFIFRFLQKGFWAQAHPFSMSIAPNGKEVRLTAKKLGDFTKNLPKIKVGTQVIIDGPHGIFTEQLITKNKLVFIAGGIGITPIRSILEGLGSRYPDKLLLYSNKSANERILGAEIDELSQTHGFKVIDIYNEEKVEGAEYGRLNKDLLARLVPNINQRDVFLCGPPQMMTALRNIMFELGVPKSQIHFERFAL